ncbi:MAG TPA: alpha-L-arabinofuranosidase C-terminal domain-containing protein [Phototrophicaceae bacterium]|nr:alpha-L-arabinofuranosidase C-terminal domain-containing protein [Phototrophicaceae bacterium]
MKITIQTDQPKAISPNLFGIFFEDLNYAADGGLYAELIQNRSFEYSTADNPDWNFFTAWELIPARGKGAISLETEQPVHSNNPHYLALHIDGEVGLRNAGFDGIVIKAGESYDLALFARLMGGNLGALTVRLESRTGEVLGEASLPAPGAEWAKYTTTIQATGADLHGRLSILISGTGTLALDVISLFPQKTFYKRPNGLRADLAQTIADLKPKFMRFPGGCLAHGDGLDNMYRWKDTIGPIETRREQFNLWSYHQSVGLGYYEYFQFCEDIGAKPVPVVPAGVCCPNTGARFNGRWEQGQQGLPMAEMPDYVQEILDLIEWANGPVTSTWGAKRAEAGHPEPFGLEYLGVGNEDRITPIFQERFKLIYEVVKAQYPEVTVIGTVGPRTDGEDYDLGWALAREMKLDMVDEHGYKTPDWYWENLARFDAYDRDGTTVYLGEYAAHDIGRRSTLRSALAEAAYMTALERNGDLVQLASYAPLLGKQRRLQWEPDLIYFDNGAVYPTINYYIQQLFSVNAGDTYLPTTVTFENDQTIVAACVRDSTSGDIILKIVSRADVPVRAQIDLSGVDGIAPIADCTVISGDPVDENNYSFWHSHILTPTTATITVAPQFDYDVPAHSLSVIRMKTGNRG